MTLPKCFSHPSLGIGSLLFGNPTNKTETGTANKQVSLGSTNSKPPGPIIMMAGQIRNEGNTVQQLDHIFHYRRAFLQVAQGRVPAPTCYEPPLQSVAILQIQKTIFRTQTRMF
jgi:hypothetical protein